MRQGNPRFVDYTPGSAVTAGDVVVVGDLPLIAHSNIAAGDLGALAAGGGVYDVIAATSAAAGVIVYWVDASNKVSTSSNSAANKRFGYVAPNSSSGADGDTVRVIHDPGKT
jgi:predicted RecA/RadA family phage recombinase